MRTTKQIVAVIGLASCLLWHVLALFGRVTKFGAPVLGLVVGLFPVLISAVARGVSRARCAERSQMWQAMLGRNSRWAERLIGGTLLYAAVIGVAVQRTPYFRWLGPGSRIQVVISADWLVCYVIATVLLHPERGASRILDAARGHGRRRDQAV